MKNSTIQYVLLIMGFLSVTGAAVAQNNATSSKVIIGKNYRVVEDNLRVTTSSNDVYVLPKDQINATVVVDNSTGKVEIDAVGEEVASQDLSRDVVILNVDGISFLTTTYYSVEAAPKGSSSSKAGSRSSASSSSSTAERSTLARTPAKSSETTSKSGGESIISRVETSILFGIGFSMYDKFVPNQTLKLRGVVEFTPRVKAGLALASDIYMFPKGVGFNYQYDTDGLTNLYDNIDDNTDRDSLINDAYDAASSAFTIDSSTLHMMSIMLGFDMPLADSSKSIVPDVVTLDFGYGFSTNYKGIRGVVFNPGAMWYLKEFDNSANLFFAIEYKYQQLSKGNNGSNILFNVGYKF
ncbi:MAG: hypothetical protein SNF68_01045 [Rikenellaceae bacterium]